MKTTAFTLFSLVVVAVILSGLTFRQPDLSSQADGGQPICGARLFINLSNTVMVVGSSNTIYCHIKNSSTNSICMFREATLYPETCFFLTNNSREFFKLGPLEDRSEVGISGVEIYPGGNYEWHTPIKMGKEVGSGDYVLKAKIWIFIPLNATNNPGGELISNSLKVRIKRPFWF